MIRSFSRKVEVLPSSIVRGSGALVAPHAHGAGAIQGTGAMGSAEAQALVQYGLISGAMFGGVVLAIKGSLLWGGAVFVGGPLVIGMALTALRGEPS